MAIPSEIITLINQLNQELERIEQKATKGLNLLEPALSSFPDNAIIIHFFATLNNAIFLVETYSRLKLCGQQLNNSCNRDTPT